ncbi:MULTISPECIES: hypothetical protein [Kocuria]|uniref:Uncharacterized protein n=1 Tax=Kocuria subflava TaxID=1736139 RepID=A0A846U4Z7_9MICC|nr:MULTISPECIES: hypothetical protein [Kocuria]NKE08796.1 hypothetical protein [Kocuria subflava]
MNANTESELQNLLAQAEAEIRQLRAEIAARQQSDVDRVIRDLPEDLSAAQGKWSDLKGLLQALARDQSRDDGE